MKVKLMLGDCLEQMKRIPDNYVDSIITDPPAGISFMNKEWDDDKGGRNNWIKWMKDLMVEAKRTLKPGGHCFVWALPRTSHWTATALEDAGFEIRDVVTHVFGSGFPKSHNISKAIDKQKGLKGEVIGKKIRRVDNTIRHTKTNGSPFKTEAFESMPDPDHGYVDVIKGACKESQQWEGWGTGLKPASEHWILCRKPLSEKTIADNVLKWGVGGINIDKSRIGFVDENDKESAKPGSLNATGEHSLFGLKSGNEQNDQGRFPANFITTIHDDTYILRDDISVEDKKIICKWLFENL